MGGVTGILEESSRESRSSQARKRQEGSAVRGMRACSGAVGTGSRSLVHSAHLLEAAPRLPGACLRGPWPVCCVPREPVVGSLPELVWGNEGRSAGDVHWALPAGAAGPSGQWL